MNIVHPKLQVFQEIFAEIFPSDGDQDQFNPAAVTEENLYKLLRYPIALMVIIAAYTGGKNIQKLFQELEDIEKDDDVYDYCISEFHFDIYIKVFLIFHNKLALFTINEIRGLIYSINCFIALCCAMIIQIRTKKKCDYLSEDDILSILSSESINNNNTLLTNRFIHTWIHLGFSQIDDDLETDNFLHTLQIQGDEHHGEDLFYYSGYKYLISSVDDEVGQISININSEGENYLYLWLETSATDIKDKERPLKLNGFNFFYPTDSLTTSDINKKHLELIKLNFYNTQELWSLIESNWTDTILRFDEYLDNNGNRNRIVNYLNTIGDKHEMLYAFNSYLTYKSLIFSLCSDGIDYNSNRYLNNKLKKYLKDYAKDTFSITERYHLYKAFKEVDDLFDMVSKTQVNTRKIPKGNMSKEEHKILEKEREIHNEIYNEHENREKAFEEFIKKSLYLKNIEISLIDIDEQDKAKRNLNRRVGQQVINVLRSNPKKQLSGSKILDIFEKQHRRKLDFPSS